MKRTLSNSITSGNQVAAITDLTPQLFSQLTSLGDGRIGLTFNENVDALGTSQLHMDVFDLRTKRA